MINNEVMGKASYDPLPEDYLAVAEIFIPDNPRVPKLEINVPIQPEIPSLHEFIDGSYRWVEHVYSLLDKEELSKEDWLSWASYNANLMERAGNTPPSITSSWMLPTFKEKATDPALMYHCMKLTKQILAAINPNQTPV